MHIFFQEKQHGHRSFCRRYLQLNFLREQSTTDLPIIVVCFISNDNENVICYTNGPKEKICYFQPLMPEANRVLSINVIRVYIGGAVVNTSDFGSRGRGSSRLVSLSKECLPSSTGNTWEVVALSQHDSKIAGLLGHKASNQTKLKRVCIWHLTILQFVF